MKVFQIVSNFCHWDATSKFPTAESTKNHFPPSDLFVEAPDSVFEGWGFDPDQEGDARFIKPTPPDGWLYDDATGVFYPDGETAPSQQPTVDERVTELEAENAMLKAQINAQSEQIDFYEDCIVEMAAVVYA
jgi:hypothetical protein